MTKIYQGFAFLLLLLLSVRSHAQPPTDVFISEYIEGSGNNKAIELYNGTGAAINLAAANYVVQYYFNGSTTASLTINLTGTVANNGVFILAQSSASFLTTNGGTVAADQTNSGSWYNGDDAVVLRKGGPTGTVVDAIGQIGFDPGTEWGSGLASTADNTLRRKAANCSGDANASDAFDPSIAYTGFATDDFSGLDSHTTSCATTGVSLTITPSSLNFSTAAGTQSAQQAYTVQGSGLTSDVTVTAPTASSFRVSLVSGGPYTSSVTISFAAANAAGGATVYAVFAPATSGTQSGTILNVSGSASASLSVQGTTATTGSFTPVFTIQGSGTSSTLTGTVVTTEGIVTADFQGPNQLNGFYIQDTAGDGNTATSDGIFVFNTSFAVAVGDYVRITATVDEFFNLTELKNLTGLTVLSGGVALPSAADVILPVVTVTDLERYEGMRVRFPQTLTATETFTLGRFGEVDLSVNGRLFNPTNFIDPNDNPASGTNSTGASNAAAVLAQQDLNNRSRIVLDDGSGVQNPPTVPFLNPSDTTLRIGSTVVNLTGVLDYAFGEYRVQPTLPPAFNYAPRPAVPSVGNANVKLASFNVLNYFNGNGVGGGFPTSRGADSLSEFVRQRTKIINAIRLLNADAVGLIEIENDGNGPQSAIADLVNGLNQAMGANTYAFVPDPVAPNGNTGTDEIKVAIIYKPAVLTPVGPSRADASPVHNRPPVAQTFARIGNGETFTFVVNHFKSKSCSGATGENTDQLDGQGCYNNVRKLQAQALLNFISALQTASGDSDVVSVGDYNAYEEEDPIDILRAGGLVNAAPGSYSYVFEGQSGSLDYALITPSLVARITGADKWHINADEPVVKSYDQQFNPPYVYSPDAFRSSDHDPLLVGLKLGNLAPSVTITSPLNNATLPAGSSVTLTAAATDTDGGIAKVEFYNAGAKFAEDTTAPFTLTGANVEAGNYLLTALAFDNEGSTAVSDTVRLTVTACTGSGGITGEGYAPVAGTQVADLLANPTYPNSPSLTAQLNVFEYANVGDNYGARLRGFICAPQTGAYTFYIAGDDQAGLWLSTDENTANKTLIAYNETPVGFRAFTTLATQKSAPINLVKGVRYYIEVLHKQSTGANHLSVAWVLPDGTAEGPVSGSRLSQIGSVFPNSVNAATPTFDEAMQRISASGSLTATVLPNPSTDQFTIYVNGSAAEPVMITVTDAAGRVVETRSNVALSTPVRMGSKWTSGIYFATITQSGKTYRLKLVKQR